VISTSALFAYDAAAQIPEHQRDWNGKTILTLFLD